MISTTTNDFNSSETDLDQLAYDPGCVPYRIQAYLSWKYFLGRCLALVLLILFAPLIGVLMLLVKATSRGPALYSQRRTGQKGKTFTMYKLRSMIVDAEIQSGKIWSLPGDRRITRFGRFLRFTHFDELPQLYNVVIGDMALVGPRPERPEFVQILIRKVDRYFKRHAVKPGITGLAQIFLPPDESVDSVRTKTKFDLFYINYMSFSMDVRILVCTAMRLFGLRYGTGPRLTGLERQVRVLQKQTTHKVSNPRRSQLAGIPRSPVNGRPPSTNNNGEFKGSSSYADHALQDELELAGSASDSFGFHVSDIIQGSDIDPGRSTRSPRPR